MPFRVNMISFDLSHHNYDLQHIFIVTPDWFVPSIRKILNTDVKAPSKSPLVFELTDEAAIHNDMMLKSYNYDLELLIQDYQHAELGYGSEFRPTSILAPLLHNHPHWNRFSSNLDKGFGNQCRFKSLSPNDQSADFDMAASRGNHKSAANDPQ